MIASTLLQRLADPFLLLALVGMAAYGFRHGAFLSVIAAMQVLAAGLVSLAALDETTEIATLAGCPGTWSGGVAFVTVFVAAIIGIRLAVGAIVPEDAVRFSPAIDTMAGAIVGLLGGMMLCAAILVACSMSPLTGGMRVDPAGIRLDTGPKLLAAFAKMAAADPDSRSRILAGEASLPYVPPEPEEEDDNGKKDASGGEKDQEKEEPPPIPPLVGEPFADENANGLFDEGEPFFDVDKSGGYTAAMTFTDSNGNGQRDIGLLERYRIGRGRWDRIITVAPPQQQP